MSKTDKRRVPRRLLLGVTAVTAGLVACSSSESNTPSVGLGSATNDGGPPSNGIDAGLSVVGTQVGDAAVGKVAQDAGPIGDVVQDAGADVVTVDAGTTVGDAGDGG